MKRFIIGFGWLVAACVAVAGTGTSNEFRLDCRTGVRTAAATETIQYSTAWATNLTAAQQGEAKAVVKIDGVPVEISNASGSFDWTAPSNIGIYRFTHQIFTNGVQVGETLNAAFKVAGELNIVNVKARQRYPWNGLVDVDCDIMGDPEKAYFVTLAAKDVGGGTNLPVRTAWQVGGSVTNDEFLVGPGHYRFVWNADADLPKGAKFSEVVIEVAGIDMEIRNVSATDAASLNSGIIISWEKNESAVAYRVYREGASDVMIGETTDLTFEDASLTVSGMYTYYVRGVFGDYEGMPSRSCSAKCLRLPVCADPLVYLPLDGDVKNYGTHPCAFGRYAGDAEWLWLENRFGEDGRANYRLFGVFSGTTCFLTLL